MIERLRAKITLIDRDSNFGAVTVALPYTTEPSDAYAYALTLSNSILALSSAALHSIKITYTSTEESVTVDEDGSANQSVALIFYRNDDDVIHTIAVPAAKDGLWLTEGVYRDELIDTATFEYATIVGLSEDVASQCVYVDGSPIPAQFITVARSE